MTSKYGLLDMIIESFLTFQGFSFLISSFIWILVEQTRTEGVAPDRFTWFSRTVAGLVCLGLVGIIRAIRQRPE